MRRYTVESFYPNYAPGHQWVWVDGADDLAAARRKMANHAQAYRYNFLKGKLRIRDTLTGRIVASRKV